jgi:hypothetical protein
MNIDLNHFHYWMQAVRESSDPMSVLDCFWRGQISSKEWLCKELRRHVGKFVTIDIHGGWNGVLASMLFQSEVPVSSIRSVDIDPNCQSIATTMNKPEEIAGRFTAVTADMCSITSNADVIINTSCEHITQDQYDIWLRNVPHDALLVLQSNNYKISEHIRIATDLEQFKQQSSVGKVLWAGELELPLYKRFMIIGKNV